ncbi:MAG: tetratricopeptide repeat protein [Candidatus Marinimicrobia bacterium]|nr:tetratricopeptide repeat protein [Candidatus Neomarinimicrobiota bacterium]
MIKLTHFWTLLLPNLANFIHRFCKGFKEYKHIVWLNVEDNFKDAVLANFILLRNLRLENVKREQQFFVCLNELSNLNGPNLLVIDNANRNLSEYYDQLPKAPNWHILITSRTRIKPFHIIDIDFLSVNDAITLFKKHCADYNDEQIKRVVEQLELHTLTIEVLAKAAKCNRWNINTTFKALGIDAMVNVSVQHSRNEKIENVKSYLTDIFNASELGEQEKWILMQFTALPHLYIDYDFLYKLLQIEKLDWGDSFSAILERLYETGFLEKKGESYKLHAVLNEVLRTSLNTSIEDIDSLLETVTALLSIDQVKGNPLENFPFISFGDAIIELFPNENNSNLDQLKNNLALVYQDLGEYEKARDLLEAASRMIDDYTNRFYYCDETTRYYDGVGSILWLDDILSITTLKTDDDDDKTYENTLTENTDFYLYPLNTTVKTRAEIRVQGSYSGFASGIAKGVEIAGVFGYGDGKDTTPYPDAGTNLSDASMDTTKTTWAVEEGIAFAIGQTIRCNSEQVYIEAISTNNLTVIRAVNGTTAAAHDDDSDIYIYEYPEPIKEACLIQTMRWWTRKDSAFADVMGVPELGIVIAKKGLDPDVQNLLRPYKRYA